MAVFKLGTMPQVRHRLPSKAPGVALRPSCTVLQKPGAALGRSLATMKSVADSGLSQIIGEPSAYFPEAAPIVYNAGRVALAVSGRGCSVFLFGLMPTPLPCAPPPPPRVPTLTGRKTDKMGVVCLQSAACALLASALPGPVYAHEFNEVLPRLVGYLMVSHLNKAAWTWQHH